VFDSIIAELDVEIPRLQRARALLANERSKRTRPTKTTVRNVGTPSSSKKRFVDPEGGERIGQG
jgi:hypothetical protein